MQNYDISQLSSSQYAFRGNICIYKDFITDEEKLNSTPVKAKIKGNTVEVGRKYDNYVLSINCFPYNYSGIPSKSIISYRLESLSLSLGFLNKQIETLKLLTYVEIIINNKYKRYGYSFELDDFLTKINKGKNMELEEMDFDKRKYVWHDN